MDPNATMFVKGLLFGFSIAAPVGPIGILCLRRSLAGGWRAGLTTGLGAASADAVYGAVAGFGLAGLAGWLVGQQAWIQWGGGLFLCWLGLRLWRTGAVAAPVDQRSSIPLSMGYLSALGLTLANPLTIVSFTAVFAGMGLGHRAAGPEAALCLVAGVFLGSMVWWTLLSGIAGGLRRRVPAGAMVWINRLSGAILIAFGLVATIGSSAG